MARLDGTIVAARVVLSDGFVGSVHSREADGTMTVGGRGRNGFERRCGVTPDQIEFCGNDVQHRNAAYCNRHEILFISMAEVTARGKAYREESLVG